MTIPSGYTAPPPVGFHDGMDARAYHKIFAASSSMLKILDRQTMNTPAHVWLALTTPREPTPAMRAGTLLDEMISDPEKFAREYVQAERCAGVTQKGDRCKVMGGARSGGEWFCGTHWKDRVADEVKPITPEEFVETQQARDNLMAHEMARKIIVNSVKQRVAIWVDPETGVTCKAMADFWVESAGMLADLKKARDASPVGFLRHVKDYGHDTQAAFYLGGWRQLGTKADQFIHVCSESKTNIAAAYQIASQDIWDAHKRNQKHLATWKRCIESGEWPGYAQDIIRLEPLPEWARRETGELEIA